MYRMIIADDEPIECRGLERMVQNGFPNIELLPSVYNGVDLLQSVSREKPDIVIADINMPGMNGLEAVEIMRMRSLDTKVIINTAYSDFDYIKKALILGACDFLQKPMEEEKFREALNRVLRILDKERAESEREEDSSQRMKKIRKVAETEIMSSIFLGKPNEEGMEVLFENLSGDYFGGIMAAASLRSGGPARLALLEERLLEAVSRYCTCLTRIHKEILYLFLIPGQQVQAEEYQEWVRELLEKVWDSLGGRDVWPAAFGVSDWKYEFEKMREAYHECQIALQGHSGEGIFFFEIKSAGKEQGYFQKNLNGMELLAAEERWEEFGKKLRRVFGGYPSEGEDLRVLRLWAARLTEQCRVTLADGQAKGKLPDLSWWEIWNAVEVCHTVEELCQCVMDLLSRREKREDGDDPRSRYVQEALLFMEKNYMFDLSLEQVAEQVGISSFYLSRLLKHQTRASFVELLTDIRLEHAINMIMREDFSVKDIGSKVGYQSPTYFYKVFKKNTGMTVGEMRAIFRK